MPPSGRQPARRRPPTHPQAWHRWVPVGAAVVVLGLVLFVATRSDGDGSSAGDTTLPSVLDTVTTSLETTTVPSVTVLPVETIPHTQLTNRVRYGSANDDVKQVQQRLTDLHFAPGPVDGQFGNGTRQAVWAFQKLVLNVPRGAVGDEVPDDMWQRMQDNLVIQPLRPTGPGTTHVEIYIQLQVLIVFTDDRPTLITHISSGVQKSDGTPDSFCEYADFNTDAKGNPLPETVTKYVCAETKTPGGIFTISHMLPGNHVGPLGGMYNPVYFNYGIAMHGAQNVPKEPASHGCVRMNEAIAETFPTLVHVRDKVYVWGQDGKQPEQYSQQESLPSFNRISDDPNATTTSTIAETTTTAPEATTTTAAAVPTTAKPVPTTTTTTPSSTAPPATEAPVGTAAPG